MSGPRTKRVRAIGAALAIVTIAAFYRLLASDFVNFDDPDYVTENRHVLAGPSPQSIAWALTATDSANWHPLTWLSHMVDARLFGLDAGRHHLTSLLIHVANVVVLFLLFVRMTGAVWRSALAACLFAIHPLHVESVAWIAERKDVLSTLFWLLTTLAWVHWLESKTVARYALVVALFAAGLMAKPMLVTLPFTLVLLDYWPLKRAPLWTLLREKAPLFAMSLASCLVTFAAQRTGGAVQSLVNVPFVDRLANSVLTYAGYLGKTLWPASLAVFYPYSESTVANGAVITSALVLAVATAIVLRLAGSAPYLVFGWLWYLGTLVPVIGLVQIGSQSMADRYTYVPLVGIFVGAAWGLAELASISRGAKLAVAGGVAAILGGLFVATRLQAAHWSDSKALFEHALAVTEDNWLAHANLGIELAARGRKDDAIRHYREAVRIRPDWADAHYNLGTALEDSGLHEEALREFNLALRLRPDHVRAHYNLAVFLVTQGRTDSAIAHFQQVVRLDPSIVDAHYNLAGLLLERGRVPEAIEQYEAVLRLRPEDAEARAHLERAREAR